MKPIMRVFASAFVPSRFTVAALFALALGSITRIAAAQAPTRTAPEIAPSRDQQYPVVADVKSIDGIMRAFYEVVSTAAGARPNQQRDASLHAPDAQIRLSRITREGRPDLQLLTLPQLHASDSTVRKQAFYEREIHRIIERFGSTAHVWSTYVTSRTPHGRAVNRGISSVQLYFDGTRWWITGWTNEDERNGHPIPARFLPR